MLHKIRALVVMDNLLPLGAVVVGLSLVWSTIGVMQRNFEFQQRVDTLRQQIVVMEIENKTIEYRIAYYKTPEYAELAARQHLNKAAPGEHLLVLPPSQYESDDISALQVQTPVPAKQQSNFEQWMRFLFGKRAGQDSLRVPQG